MKLWNNFAHGVLHITSEPFYKLHCELLKEVFCVAFFFEISFCVTHYLKKPFCLFAHNILNSHFGYITLDDQILHITFCVIVGIFFFQRYLRTVFLITFCVIQRAILHIFLHRPFCMKHAQCHYVIMMAGMPSLHRVNFVSLYPKYEQLSIAFEINRLFYFYRLAFLTMVI